MPYFVSTIKKTQNGFPWVNSYLLLASTLKDAHDGAEAYIVPFEKTLHNVNVDFEELRTAGYKTTDPNDFMISVLGGTGARVIAETAQAAPFTALHWKLEPTSGRVGKKFYRYCLANNELHGLGDNTVLDLAPATQTAFEAAMVVMISNLSGDGVTLSMGAPDGAAGARQVTVGLIAGVAQLDVHHGWFNKAT